jgi:hypothetical protein
MFDCRQKLVDSAKIDKLRRWEDVDPGEAVVAVLKRRRGWREAAIGRRKVNGILGCERRVG